MGKTIGGQYEILSELGEGGMGMVYKGLDTRTNTPVAIKQMKSNLVDKRIIERFKREGEALRELNHPNIVKMLDAIDEDDEHYLVMEYVAGGDLRQAIQTSPLQIDRIINMAIDIADALTRAHRLDIIHRDLKPANVLIGDDGVLRLTDFGIAHVDKGQKITEKNTVMGTVHYLSPELLDGEQIDTRSDIWSFGVMLFEMLTGKYPFDGNTELQIIRNIATMPVPDLEALNPDCPIALVDLVYRMLDKDRTHRIRSVRLVGAELETMMQGAAIPARSAAGTGGATTNRFTARVPQDDAPKHNLPAQITQFVGRESELVELGRLINDPQIRLITIVASGGMGKTRLVMEQAARILGITNIRDGPPLTSTISMFTDGVYFVDLVPLRDPSNIVNAIAAATSFQFVQDERKTKQQILLNFLSNKRMLLIMDNYEHLLDGAGLVSDILKAAPDVKIIATSRERLNLVSETIFELEGMDFPDWETPEDALEYTAVKLFMQSARRVLPGFELQADDLEYVARICRLVYGVPLGILLAAAWLEMLSLEEIVEEITQSLDFLETVQHNIPERQRSIRAVFDYSWNLLDKAERKIFMQMAIFQGGMTIKAAQKVIGCSLRQLMALVNKSLLRRDSDKGRFHIHELIRQYAAEKLAEVPELEEQLRDRHATYYAAFTHQRAKQLLGDNQRMALDEISAESMNIQLGFQRSLVMQQFEVIEQYMDGLRIYYSTCFQGWIGLEIFGMATTLLGDGLESAGTRQQRLYAIAMASKCMFNIWFPTFQGARVLIDEALAILNQLDAQSDKALPFFTLGLIDYVSGDYAKSEPRFQESLAIYTEAGDHWGKYLNLNMLGRAAYRLGEYEKAKALLEDGLRICGDVGDRYGTVLILCSLGRVLRAMGEYEQAERPLQEGLLIYEELGSLWGTGYVMIDLGEVAFEQKHYAVAHNILHKSLEKFEMIGLHNYATARVFRTLGRVASAQNKYREAHNHFGEALRLTTTTDAVTDTPYILLDIATVFAAEERRERALEITTMVLQQSTLSYETRQDAQGLIAKLAGELDKEAYNSVQERGKQLDLEAVVKELLAEFGEGTE